MAEMERADKIESITQEILNYKGNKKLHFDKKYPEFVQRYPILFDMCCDPRCDKQKLDYILSMYKKVENNSMTSQIASVNVGQHMFDTYVKPIVESKEHGSAK
jgi:hypothetical protein